MVIIVFQNRMVAIILMSLTVIGNNLEILCSINRNNLILILINITKSQINSFFFKITQICILNNTNMEVDNNKKTFL